MGLAASWSLNAAAYTIEDDYWGAEPTGGNYEDLIGGTNFEIQGIDVAFYSGMMEVKVFTNYSEPESSFGTEYGDLFISTDGWTPYGTGLDNYDSDNASNGEDWEFAFDTDAGTLVQISEEAILKSDYFFADTGYIYRSGQETQVNDSSGAGAYDPVLKDKSWIDLNHVGFGGHLTYHIDLASLGVSAGDELGLHWNMTCANDTVEGSVSVPEPGTLAMFGLGLAGLGWTRARRRRATG